MRGQRILRGQSLKRRHFLKQATTVLFIILLFALVHVGVRVQVIGSGYQIRKLMNEQEQLKGENHALKVEVATLRSPVRLEAIARNMGLGRAPEQQVTVMMAREP